jgi:hypothetical protein
MSAIVSAESLAEAALILLALQTRAQTGSTAFRSNHFNAKPAQWKFDELVNAAARPDANVIDNRVATMLLAMHSQRQRIHIGRFLSGASSAELDIKPEAAESAKLAAASLLRAITNWLAARAAQ